MKTGSGPRPGPREEAPRWRSLKRLAQARCREAQHQSPHNSDGKAGAQSSANDANTELGLGTGSAPTLAGELSAKLTEGAVLAAPSVSDAWASSTPPPLAGEEEGV